jgi:tripartite-type tricarboxylate transporter receptor subunit TctC
MHRLALMAAAFLVAGTTVSVAANYPNKTDPKVIERFAQLGTELVSPERATPAVLDQHLQAEIAKWKPVIQAAGVYAD